MKLYEHMCEAYQVEPIDAWIQKLALFNTDLSHFCFNSDLKTDKEKKEHCIPLSDIDKFSIMLFNRLFISDPNKKLNPETFPKAHMFLNPTADNADYYTYQHLEIIGSGIAKLLWDESLRQKQASPHIILLLAVTITMIAYKCLCDVGERGFLGTIVFLLVKHEFINEKMQDEPFYKYKPLDESFASFDAKLYLEEKAWIGIIEQLVLEKMEWKLASICRGDGAPFLPMLDENQERTRNLTKQTARLKDLAAETFKKSFEKSLVKQSTNKLSPQKSYCPPEP